MLTPDQLNFHKAKLSDWLPPEEFGRTVDELMKEVEGRQFFNDPRIGFLRDAWVASKVASALIPDAITLAPRSRPDFETLKDGQLCQYDVTEADLQGRRRGENDKLQFDPGENWIARARQVPGALKRAALDESEKGLSPLGQADHLPQHR